MTAAQQQLASALADRYRIERELGQGGMATVYLAEDLKHKRRVALKVLKPELAAVLGAERFVQEITTTAALQHPHVLPLFDSGEADGFLYYVMPFIDGETLRAKLDRETQLGVDEAVKIATDVADALQYAHDHGVIHRDIKPENILLANGRPMVADFGIALAVSAAAGGRMTETGLSLGTPHYMSPEQATAEKEITRRSDIYSLASVLYEMLTGDPPHTGSSAQQVIMKIITEQPQPVATLRKSVPSNVGAAIAKALEKLPADRFTTAKEFADALVNSEFRIAGESERAGPTVGRRRSFSLSAFAGVAAIAIVATATAVAGWLRSAPAAAPVRFFVNLAAPAHGEFQWHAVALSPDGLKIAFIDSVRGTIFVKTPDEAAPARLAGTEGVQALTFSSDGEWIAFATNGRLRKIRRGGGEATTIAEGVTAPRLSIAWLDNGTMLFNDAQGNLKAVGDEGGTVRVVISRDSLPNRVFDIAALRGSRTALVVTCASNCFMPQLWAVNVASGARRELVNNAHRVWHTNGDVVVFADQRKGQLFAASFDEKRLAFRAPPVSVLEGVRRAGGEFIAAEVAENGTLLFAPAAGPPLGQMVWITREGSIAAADSAWSFDGDGTALSPDGRRLAAAVTSGATTDIWVRDLAPGGAYSRLSFTGKASNPTWSADGKTVLFQELSERGSGADLFRRRIDGSDSTRLVFHSPRDLHTVTFLRDSTKTVVRFGPPPTRGIYLAQRAADGSFTFTPLLSSDRYETVAPSLSPDERWLAYVSNESGRQEVYVVPFRDVNAGRWQVSLAGGRSPRWAHSGHELFFRDLTDGLLAVPVTSDSIPVFGERRRLFQMTGLRFSDFSGSPMELQFDVSPDDRRFLFNRAVGRADDAAGTRTILVQNWLTEVSRRMSGGR